MVYNKAATDSVQKELSQLTWDSADTDTLMLEPAFCTSVQKVIYTNAEYVESLGTLLL